MKSQSIRNALLAALLGLSSSAQANFFWNLASFFGNIGLAEVCIPPALQTTEPVLTAAKNQQYVNAVLQYTKPFAIGAAALTLAGYIEPKDAGFLTDTVKGVGKHMLQTFGTTMITIPALITCQEVIQKPLFEPYDKKSTIELASKYVASLGVGFTALHMSKIFGAEGIAAYLAILIKSTARNAITYPTIFLGKKYFKVDEYIESIEDEERRNAEVHFFGLVSNLAMNGFFA